MVHPSTLRSLKKWDAIHIEWVDILCDNTAHSVKKFVDEFRPCERKSIGYFVGLREIDGVTWLFIVDTDDRSSQAGDNGELDGEHFNAFPIAIILHLERLPIKGRPKG